GAGAEFSTSRQMKEYADKVRQPGLVAADRGDAAAGLGKGTKVVEAYYQTPYLAHATMEPMNCTAQVTADRGDVWAPTQASDDATELAAKITGMPVEKVFVKTTFIGGGFGRRYSQDYVAQAVTLAKALGGRPVKLVWSREEDITRDNNF